MLLIFHQLTSLFKNSQDKIEKRLPKKPKVGMAFIDMEEAYQFFNTCAGAVGFGVRQSSFRYDKEKKHKVEAVCMLQRRENRK